MPASITIGELLIPGLILGSSVLIFVIMLLIAVVQWKKVAAARRWPVAKGKVLESRVEESSDSDGGLQYLPVIKYEYSVGQQVFVGDLLAFGSRNVTDGGVWGEKKAHKTVAKYPAGSIVQVHYDPEMKQGRPATAVLEVRSAIANLLLLIGVIFLLTGTLVAAIVLIVNRPTIA